MKVWDEGHIEALKREAAVVAPTEGIFSLKNVYACKVRKKTLKKRLVSEMQSQNEHLALSLFSKRITFYL